MKKFFMWLDFEDKRSLAPLHLDLIIPSSLKRAFDYPVVHPEDTVFVVVRVDVMGHMVVVSSRPAMAVDIPSFSKVKRDWI